MESRTGAHEMLKLRQIMPRQVVGLGESLLIGPIQVMTLQLAISTANLDDIMTKFIISKRREHNKTDANFFLTKRNKSKLLFSGLK